jgi:excisionase family DNA binding protein
MALSLAQAAAATGLHKTTILRAVRTGRITGTRDPLGQWRVEPTELHRVFPPAEAATVRTGAVRQKTESNSELQQLARAE